jgi:SAM-dependent methyltransferase
MSESKDEKRAHVRELAAQFAERGDTLGWFDALYREAEGSTDIIPWADMAPNPYFREWAEKSALKGEGRKALVVGCGLGDDAKYLYDLGFEVTAFDISPTAIEWAKRLHKDTNIQFEVGNLFEPFRGWLGAFEFVLEIYTIQPLPMDMRDRAIDAVAGFVAPGGRLVVVTKGREDEDEPQQLPWPLSRRDLSRFLHDGMLQMGFDETWDDEDKLARFIVEYRRPGD